MRDAGDGGAWIGDMLALSMCALEAPVLVRLHAAWDARDIGAVGRWNDLLLASRETAELRAETVQMGYSLARLVPALGLGDELRTIRRARVSDRVCLRERPVGHRTRRRGPRVYLVLARESGARGAEGAPARTDRRPTHVDRAGRAPSRSRSIGHCRPRMPTARPISHPGSRCSRAAHETQYSRLFRS